MDIRTNKLNPKRMETENQIKEPCPNCKETEEVCACLRNICLRCGGPVGNITFTYCDDCWDKKPDPLT